MSRRDEPQSHSGLLSGAPTLLMTGCLAGIAVRGTIPGNAALLLCAVCGTGMGLSLAMRVIAAWSTRTRRQIARERALARIAHRIDRHIPRAHVRHDGPHDKRRVPERQFMPVAQASRRIVR